MRLYFVTLCASLAASTLATTPAGQLGLCLGVKRNSDGQCKQTSDYESDFDTLSQYTKTVRVYAASDCNTLQNIGPALEAKGFSLYLGVWPTDAAHFQAEQQALQTYLPTISASTIKGITVGSEALYRYYSQGTDYMTPQQLADAINTVKDLIKNIKDKDGNSYANTPVGTVDSWNVLVDAGALPAINAADFVWANAFSYWQGQAMNNASYSFFDDIMQALQSLQTAKGTTNFDFWVGETGWATAGENFGSAAPTVQNAAQFWQQAVCAIRGWGINTFVFEAFDEAWKPESAGNAAVEKHWGILDQNGVAKYDLSCEFSSSN